MSEIENTAPDTIDSTQSDVKLTVYQAEDKSSFGLIKSVVSFFRNIFQAKELIFQLFKRDFLGINRQTFLGVTSGFVTPLFAMLSWVFLNAAGLLHPGEMKVPYPIFVLMGTVFWGLFMGFYDSSSTCLTKAGDLIRQVGFNHEILVAHQVLISLMTFTINLVLLICIFLLFGLIPSWKVIMLPLLILPFLFLGVGFGLVISVISLVAHDVSKIVSLFLNLLMFITPVIYAPKFSNPLFQKIVSCNPLGQIIMGTREVILFGTLENPRGYFLSTLLAFVFFIYSIRVFYLVEQKVVERL